MYEILLPSRRQDRMRGAARYPNEAALLARIPILRRRVPFATLWRRRPVASAGLARELIAGAPFAGRGARQLLPSRRPRRRLFARRRSLAEQPAVTRLGHAAGRMNEAVQRRRRLRGTIPMLFFIATGLALMYYLDPQHGRRRRALVRDRLAHARNMFTREWPERAERRGRFLRGVARGVRHNAAGVLRNGQHAPVDNETLVDRVRSEVLRSRGIKAGEIHVDAYLGTVTLRGQLQHPDQIRHLIEDTSRVEGVRRVRSYLHLPGTLAPNKAEIYELEHAPGSRW